MKRILSIVICLSFIICFAHKKIVYDSALNLELYTNSSYREIMKNKQLYPKSMLLALDRNEDMLNFVHDYPHNKGKVYSNTIGTVQKGIYPLLIQYDQRWGYGMYGNNVIGMNGCGPTCASMIIAGMTGRNDITPYNVASYAYKNGYYRDGTAWSFFTEGMKHYGIRARNIPLSKSSMVQSIMSGHPLISSMKPGDFTTTGHLIVIKGIKNGMFMVNDPNSKKRSYRLWSYETLSPQIKSLWSFSK